jgi:predicted nucleic acid-binding protein
MEQRNYLIDTNSVIDYLGLKIPNSGMDFINSIIVEVPKVSIITKIEVLGFNAPENYYQLLTDFMNDAIILDLSNNIVESCIEIRKENKIKLPDAIIAATALVNNLTIISRNVSDFQNIDEISVINPYNI